MLSYIVFLIWKVLSSLTIDLIEFLIVLEKGKMTCDSKINLLHVELYISKLLHPLSYFCISTSAL
jgi:hypothetical protein